jgi:uncharacterized protein YukE
MSSLESRISNIIRTETNALKQQISRLDQSNSRIENALSSLKKDVGLIINAVETLRGK